MLYRIIESLKGGDLEGVVAAFETMWECLSVGDGVRGEVGELVKRVVCGRESGGVAGVSVG